MDYKTILVTGGAGFIGHHLVQALVKLQFKVIVVDDLSTGKAEFLEPDVDLRIIDIMDKKALEEAFSEKIDVVFHLAAKVSIRQSLDKTKFNNNVNLLGFHNVFDLSEEYGVKKFVLASTMGIYADARPGILINEDSLKKPLSPYGVAKLDAENYLLSHCNSGANISGASLRLFNTYGTGQQYTPYVGVLTIFIHSMLKNKQPTIYGDGSQIRDFIHVKDVVSAFLSCLSDKIEGAYNVGTGQGISITNLYQLVAKYLGFKAGAVFLPERPEELKYSVADINKLSQCIGFSPKHNLEDSLEEIVNSIKN